MLNYYEIGQRIRKFRKAMGMSQETRAEKIDISVTHMSHIETGNTKMSLPVLVALAETLEVKADDLLFEKPSDRSTVSDDISELFTDCSAQELGVIHDVIKTTKSAIRKYM